MQRNENRIGYMKTKVGWIPEEWRKTSLGAFTKWGSGGTPSKAIDSYWNGDIPWISAISMHTTKLSISKLKISEKGLKAGSRLAPKSSILLLVRGSMLFKRIPVGITKRDVAFNQDVKSIIPDEKMASSEYLLCWLLGHEQRLLGMVGATGIGAGKLDLRELQSMELALPPLFEQKVIVETVKLWDRGIKRLELKIETKRQIKRGLMQRLLSGQTRLPGFGAECRIVNGELGIPAGWKNVRLEKVFEFIKTYAFSREKLTTEGVGNSTIYNIHYGDIHATYTGATLNFAKEKRVPMLKTSDGLPEKLQVLQDGDLVMADASEDYEGIGACIELKNITERKITGGLHTFVLRDTSKHTANGFRGYMFKEYNLAKELKRIATGISVYGISKTNLAKVVLTLPPIQEQRAIADVLSTADEEVDALERKLALWKDQKKFLLNNLVTGTIRVPAFAGK